MGQCSAHLGIKLGLLQFNLDALTNRPQIYDNCGDPTTL